MDNRDSVVAALVGCGRIGTQTIESLRYRLPRGWHPLSHVEAILAQPGVELAAFCDVDPQRLSWAARTYHVKQCFNDYVKLIDTVCPDLLSIATRTTGRTDIVRYAAMHGVRAMHVEKPFALNLADCDSALTAISENGVHLSYGTTRRYMDIYRQAKVMLDAGEIGNIEQIAVEHGRTMLFWNHPHSVDLLLYFAGTSEISKVQAQCTLQRVSDDGMTVDDDPLIENALVLFENGINGVITSARGLNTRISGSKGLMTIMADGTGIEIRTNRGGGPCFLDSTYLDSQAQMSGTQVAIAELVSAVHGPVSPTILPAEIRCGLNILLATVYSSLQGGRAVNLAEVPSQFTVTGRFGDLYA